MDKSIFSPSQSGRLIYLPFILLLTFGLLASRVSGMQTHGIQDSIRHLFRLPQLPAPPKVPALPAPPHFHAPEIRGENAVAPPPAPRPPVMAAPARPKVPAPPAPPRSHAPELPAGVEVAPPPVPEPDVPGHRHMHFSL